MLPCYFEVFCGRAINQVLTIFLALALVTGIILVAIVESSPESCPAGCTDNSCLAIDGNTFECTCGMECEDKVSDANKGAAISMLVFLYGAGISLLIMTCIACCDCCKCPCIITALCPGLSLPESFVELTLIMLRLLCF